MSDLRDLYFSGVAMATDSRSIENPNVPFSSEEFWDSAIGDRMSTSGMKLGSRSALTYAPVWQAVTMISGGVAKLPLYLYNRKKGQVRTEAVKHPVYPLVLKKPNPVMSAFRFWRQVMTHVSIWNVAYVYIDRAKAGEKMGQPVGLYPLLPDRTRPEWIKGNLYYVTETTDPNYPEDMQKSRLFPIPADDVLHLSGIEFAMDEPCILVEKARNSWATGLAAQNFTSRFFSNGVKSGGILEVPPGVSQTYVQNLEKGIEEGYTKENKWFKTIVLRDGVKFHRWSMSPAEAEMTPTREEEVCQVARWFNMQPSRLGIARGSSYNSKAEDNRDFLDTTLSPHLAMITGECGIKLLSTDEQDSDEFYFEHDTEMLLQMNYREQVVSGSIATKAGLLTVDEWRVNHNYPPHPGGQGSQVPSIGKQADLSGANKGANDQPRGPAKDELEQDAPTVDDERMAYRRNLFFLTSSVRRKLTEDGFSAWARRRLISLAGEDEHVRQIAADLQRNADRPDFRTVIEDLCNQYERAA